MELGLSRKEVAKTVKTSIQIVYNIESGRAPLTPKLIPGFAEALMVDEIEVIGWVLKERELKLIAEVKYARLAHYGRRKPYLKSAHGVKQAKSS